MQCDRLGFTGTIWPVNPRRESMEGRACFKTLQDLPDVPDAAFIAIPNVATVESVEHLASVGAGGAVCYASGFSEVGGDGAALQERLSGCANDLAIVGPNCYGVLNYVDGLALWPDEQGGRRCERGVAIISQSGNITVNFSMQRRALPLAYLISTGNMAGVQPHEYIEAMLQDDRVTAIGLYLEGIPDAVALSEMAIAALRRRVPIVALVSGRSEAGSQITLTHSSSLSGQAAVNSAFFERYGIVQVRTIPEFLETLKFMSICEPLASRSIATISCSGGEAALMADHAESLRLEFEPLTEAQESKLQDVLGDKVVISNPLDYHTYIWGVPSEQKKCFQAVYEGGQSLSINAIDYPSENACETAEWDGALQAVIDARSETQAQVAVMATMHENFPESVQLWLAEHDVAPMLGMDECFKAAASSATFYEHCERAGSLVALSRTERQAGDAAALTEFEGKRELARFGLPVAEGMEVSSAQEAVAACQQLGYPVALKASAPDLLHKTDAGGVCLDLASDDAVRQSVARLSKLADRFLIERMAPAPLAELIVGVRYDERYGLMMVLGSGGVMAELVNDAAIMLFPIDDAAIDRALESIKVGSLLRGYRGRRGDVEAVRRSIKAVASYAAEQRSNLIELDVNPLFVYQDGGGVIAVDVAIRKMHGD